jgi:dienelactone hydrolase
VAQTLSSPAGPYRVGTSLALIVDSSRAELTRADNSRPRRLIVQLWYPALPTPGNHRAPYIPELEETAGDIRQFAPELMLALDSLAAPAFWEAPPVASRRFPLVVFSPGMNSARYFYTGLEAELASHGFVVAAIDHPFWSIAGSFPDGSRLTYGESMAARDRLTSDQIDGLMQEGIAMMAEDQALVASRLPTAAPRLADAIDAGRVGVLGHSMGGMAATRACWAYRVFSACASLDGLVWAREGYTPIGVPPARVAKPFFLLLSPQFLPPDLTTIAGRYRGSWRSPSLCLLPGSRHNSVTDLPRLRRTLPEPGELPPDAAATVIQRAVISFFHSALGAPSGPSAGPLLPPPGLDSLLRPISDDSTRPRRLACP